MNAIESPTPLDALGSGELILTDKIGLKLELLGPEHIEEWRDKIQENRDYLINAGEVQVVIDGLNPKRLARRLKRHSYPSADATFGIRANSELAGVIRSRLPFGADTSEVSGWVTEEHADKGYATSALSALTQAILGQGYGVSARARNENSGSIGALEKAGFQQTRRNRKGILIFAIPMPATAYNENWDA